ncbi:FitA-like ribbon-helix-helix domain-containing protein [Caballeronia sp. LZ033]|uniref:FitA-like ribbon-helix-helix domain-containing protein n=1 Tax=Caballeronia sp. LZ033 TaxID=3038566 RepID=UPI0038D47EF4
MGWCNSKGRWKRSCSALRSFSSGSRSAALLSRCEDSHHSYEDADVVAMSIQNIDERLETRLRMQAARHGRSMEDEAREILRAALFIGPGIGRNLVDSIRGRIEPLGGIELKLPKREPIRGPLGLDE